MNKYSIDEFVSFKCSENKSKNKFEIALEGDEKYKNLISYIIGNIKISEDEIRELVE